MIQHLIIGVALDFSSGALNGFQRLRVNCPEKPGRLALAVLASARYAGSPFHPPASWSARTNASAVKDGAGIVWACAFLSGGTTCGIFVGCGTVEQSRLHRSAS